MSGIIKPSNKKEIIPLDEPEPELGIVPNAKQSELIYYEDPGDYVAFGNERDYSTFGSDDSGSDSGDSSTSF